MTFNLRLPFSRTTLFSLAACLSSCLPVLAIPSSSVVISQVYGGGGNSGATYKNDFIEIFNLGSTSVNLAGYSVQYASSAGTSWSVTNLSGSIAPGGYYLIQEAQARQVQLTFRLRMQPEA